MGLVAVVGEAALGEVFEEILRHAREGLHAGAVEAQDVVSADERDAEEFVVRVLNASDRGVRDAFVPLAALPAGEVWNRGCRVAGEGCQARRSGAGEGVLEPSEVVLTQLPWPITLSDRLLWNRRVGLPDLYSATDFQRPLGGVEAVVQTISGCCLSGLKGCVSAGQA
ncbi:hypothetical protein ACFRMQ_31545 [Kitasatospora sp. NPDC056783]|uniref:hypothetical protein n=1 Tax=Kitasatospora sp. NPDC056783 TaxID=3345943 RepID=UPI0036765BE5